MKRFITLAAIAAVCVGVLAAPALAGNAKGNKFQCFSGTTDGGFNGTCLAEADSAILSTVDADTDPNNSYAGVYLSNSNLAGKLLADVNRLAFTYDGADVSGGSPRLSLPIDSTGDGQTDAYAFVDSLGCNDGSATDGTLDAIADSSCLIWYANVPYENWAAFAAANPTYRIAPDALPFVIVDQPGVFTISNIQLGKAAAKSAR